MLKRVLRTGATVLLVLAAVAGVQPALVADLDAQAATPTRVLFIRGANDTVGADGVDNNQLSDIADLVTNPKTGKGYGLFVQELLGHGFEVAQLDESGTRDQPRGVDLTKADLSQYQVVVFGSNNATYTSADVKAVTDFVAKGGGVLFMADRNWGPASGKASTSDDFFLGQWGITLQQDNAQTETDEAASFLFPNHPTLKGISTISSFGVSACTVGPAPATAGLASPPTVLVPFTTSVQENVAAGDGPQRPATPADGALVVAQPGKGRVACFFDRDPFFDVAINDPKFQNATLGLNLVNWVAAKT